MLQAIRDSRRKVGFKPAGGISSVADAGLYLRLADTILGEDWVMPSTFASAPPAARRYSHCAGGGRSGADNTGY